MPEDPPSILPRGTIILPPVNPSPQRPASAVYIQSVSGFCCSTGQAAGISSSGGGGPPASSNATRHSGSSESRLATTAPAEPPPTTTKSNGPAFGAAFGCPFIDTPPRGRSFKRICGPRQGRQILTCSSLSCPDGGCLAARSCITSSAVCPMAEAAVQKPVTGWCCPLAGPPRQSGPRHLAVPPAAARGAPPAGGTPPPQNRE